MSGVPHPCAPSSSSHPLLPLFLLPSLLSTPAISSNARSYAPPSALTPPHSLSLPSSPPPLQLPRGEVELREYITASEAMAQEKQEALQREAQKYKAGIGALGLAAFGLPAFIYFTYLSDSPLTRQVRGKSREDGNGCGWRGGEMELEVVFCE